MKDDVVFRNDLKKAIEEELWLSDSAKAAFRNILVHVPAVDAETVFKQVGLVKEAFDMAKADLMPVVRCKDCNHRHSSEFCECRPEDGFCNDGERRTDK